eukprot:jgi/Tetstr1/439689/TSEL_028108.t1
MGAACSAGNAVGVIEEVSAKPVQTQDGSPTQGDGITRMPSMPQFYQQGSRSFKQTESKDISGRSINSNVSFQEEDGLQRSSNDTSATKSVKSLRRQTSVYSDFNLAQERLAELGGGQQVRETKFLRAGSVKNTGVFVNQYAIVKNLGAGSFGKVKLAMDTVTGELVAIKFQKEINVMKCLRHPNVVQLIEVIDDPNEEKLMMVMEYVDGGSVEIKHPLPEEQARKLFQDAAKGLYYLHENNIIHGDVKPDNMMMSDEEGIVKLTDFGSASMLEHGDTMSKTTGTPAFMCPEMCESKPYHGRTADSWALAVCLWTFVYAKLPFEGSTIVALYDAIKDTELHFPEEPAISPELKDLLSGCLKKDPMERMTLENMLTHPWTTNGGKVKLIEGGIQVDAFLLAETAKKVLLRQNATLLKEFPRRKFVDGEYLFMVGNPAVEMYFLEAGEVEVVIRAVDRQQLLEENIKGAAAALSDSDESYDSEEESDCDLPNEQEDGIVAPGDKKTRPAWAVGKFSQSTYNMVKNVTGSLHTHMSRRSTVSGEELLGKKTAGQFVGTVGKQDDPDDLKHTTTVRAKGEVEAVVISRQAAYEFIAANPATSGPLQKAINKRETENQVFNVMARLSTLHKSIKDIEHRQSQTILIDSDEDA